MPNEQRRSRKKKDLAWQAAEARAVAKSAVSDLIEDAFDILFPSPAFGTGFKPVPIVSTPNSLYDSIELLRELDGEKHLAGTKLRTRACDWMLRDFRSEWMSDDAVEAKRYADRVSEGEDIGVARRRELLPTHPKSAPPFVLDLYGKGEERTEACGLDRAFGLMQSERARKRLPPLHYPGMGPFPGVAAQMWGAHGFVKWFAEQARRPEHPPTFVELEALSYVLPERRPIHVHLLRNGKITTLKFGPYTYRKNKPYHLLWTSSAAMRFQPAVPDADLVRATDVASKLLAKPANTELFSCDVPRRVEKRKAELSIEADRRAYRAVTINMKHIKPGDLHPSTEKHTRKARGNELETIYERLHVSQNRIKNKLLEFHRANEYRDPSDAEFAGFFKLSAEDAREVLRQYKRDDLLGFGGF